MLLKKQQKNTSEVTGAIFISFGFRSQQNKAVKQQMSYSQMQKCHCCVRS